MKKKHLIVSCLTAMVFTASFAAGQENIEKNDTKAEKAKPSTYKTVRGYVYDDLGIFMNAKVTAENEAGETICETLTDNKGNFDISYNPDSCIYLKVIFTPSKHPRRYQTYIAKLDTIPEGRLQIKLLRAPKNPESDNDASTMSMGGEFTFDDYMTAFTYDDSEAGPELASLAPVYPSASVGVAPTPSRWRLGGNIGFGFSNDFTNINIAPKIGYALTKGITVGGGVSYNYYDNKRYEFTENYFGMNLYASVHPIQYITIFIQPEGQRRWGKDRWGRSESEFLPCCLVGGGIVIPTGYRSGMSVTFYYDVIRNDHSPYGDRVGYSVGYTFML